MTVYAVKSEPFDNTDGDWPSMGICVSHNGRPLEIHVVDTFDEDSEATEPTKDLAKLIYDFLIEQGF